LNNIIKSVQHCFNIKKSHFKDGWANFDAMDYYKLSQACASGCRMTISPNTQKTVTILWEYPNMMCFGKVSEKGDIVLSGITGFPNDNVCVKYMKDVSDSAKRKKIEDNYVFIEW
jgi:hypothetical protein